MSVYGSTYKNIIKESVREILEEEGLLTEDYDDLDYVEEYYWLDEDDNSFYVSEDSEIVYEELSEKAKKRLKTAGKVALGVGGAIAAGVIGKKAYDKSKEKGGKFAATIDKANDKVESTKAGKAVRNAVDNGRNAVGTGIQKAANAIDTKTLDVKNQKVRDGIVKATNKLHDVGTSIKAKPVRTAKRKIVRWDYDPIKNVSVPVYG